MDTTKRMTLTDLAMLLSWDIAVNRGFSWDCIRACLLMIEVRCEQYGYHQYCHGRLPRVAWYLIRFLGSILQWFLCRANIPGTVTIGRGLRLPHPQNIIIAGYAVIGEFCTIYQNVSIVWNGFKPTRPRTPAIGDRVLFGTGCILIGDIVIGNDVLLGAGSVVSRSIDSGHRVISQPPQITPRPPSAQAAIPGSPRHLHDPYSIWR